MMLQWAVQEELRRNPPWAIRAVCGCPDVVTLVDPDAINRRHRRCGRPFKRMLTEWKTTSKMGWSASGEVAITSTGATAENLMAAYPALFPLAAVSSSSAHTFTPA